MVTSVELLSSREIISSETIPQNRSQAYGDIQREYSNTIIIPKYDFNRQKTLPNGLAVFQAAVTREDFNKAGAIDEIPDNLLGKKKGFGFDEVFSILEIKFEPNFYGIVNPDRNIGVGVDLTHNKVLFAPVVIKTGNHYQDIESLNWLKGILGEGANGERINDPSNVEHVQHEWGIARSLLNVIYTSIKSDRIRPLYKNNR